MNVLIGRACAQGLLAQGGAARISWTTGRNVLVRRANSGWKDRRARLEVLEGYMVAFRSLIAIEIIRYGDDPKSRPMAEFRLTEVQVRGDPEHAPGAPCASPGEMGHAPSTDPLRQRAGLVAVLAGEGSQWARIAEELRDTRQIRQVRPGGQRHRDRRGRRRQLQIDMDA